MALLETYTQRNLLPVQALKVELSQDYDIDKEPGQTWQPISRHVTKSYAYIGMTEKAARECMMAKIAQYTRRVELSGLAGGYKPTGPLECVAEVTMTPQEGDNWQVDVNVDYTDSFDPPWPSLGPSENYPPVPDKLAALSREVCLDEPLDRMSAINIDTAEYVPYVENGAAYDRVFIGGFAQSVYDPVNSSVWSRQVEVCSNPLLGDWVPLADFRGQHTDGRLIFERPTGGGSGTFGRAADRYVYIRVKIWNAAATYYSNVVANERFPLYFASQGGK